MHTAMDCNMRHYAPEGFRGHWKSIFIEKCTQTKYAYNAEQIENFAGGLIINC